MNKVKLCKQGHLRTPDNIDKKGACKLCIKLNGKTESTKEQQKKWYENKRNTQEFKEKISSYNQTPEHEAARIKYIKSSKGKQTQKEYIENLEDGYVAARLGCKKSEISPDLIELKRNQLLFKRELRSLKKAIGGN